MRLISNQGPPSEGGWNAFASSWVQVDILDPLLAHFSLPPATRRAPVGRATRAWTPCATPMRAISLVEKRQITKRTEVVNATVVTHIPLASGIPFGGAQRF